MDEPRSGRGLGIDTTRSKPAASTSPQAPQQAVSPPRSTSAHVRRNSDGALEDELARVALSDEHIAGGTVRFDIGSDDRAPFPNRFYGSDRREMMGTSVFVPPQFNGSFLVDDDDLTGSVPAHVSLGRYEAGGDGEFDRPSMGRRDSIGALDLAPLAQTQTRRASRGNVRSDLSAWDAMRMHGGSPYEMAGLPGMTSQATYGPSHQAMAVPPHMQHMGKQQLQDQQQQHIMMQQHGMYAGGANGMPRMQHSPHDQFARAAFRDNEYRVPMMMPGGPGAYMPSMPHSNSSSSFAEDWQTPDAASHQQQHQRRGIPKSVSVPTSLTDVDNGVAGVPQQGARGGWDERGYPPGGRQQFSCRSCKNPACNRGSICRYNATSPSQINPYGGPLRHSTSGSLEVEDRANGATGNGREKGSRSSAKSPGGGVGGGKSGGSHKRNPSEGTRFPPLEQLKGQIYPLCRDQHGCRHLQKKLEEGEQAHIDLIFSEIYDHILELMSDPFGNYLCQKLFTHCNDEQKLTITRKSAPGLVAVSLNMHGTRSVQKLIDCLNTDEQVQVVVDALRDSVVPLIKDLNGNHVIQKCLNRLRAEQNQFIYDAVSQNCVAVASHRHGCCVLQRCIDHANDAQKIQLAAEIAFNALTLVQDAFGNYVVQYILDLKLPRFSDALIRRFLGHVYELSLQKFSSNVIEKCIRVAEPDTRRGLIAGLLDRERLPHLLQDSFANYVVQTSLDVSEPEQYAALVEIIRPVLPSIRHLPYCKRIQSKLARDTPGGMPLPLTGNNPNQMPAPMGAPPMMHNVGHAQPMHMHSQGAMMGGYGMMPPPQMYAPQYHRGPMGHMPPPSQQHPMYFMQTAPTGASE